MLGRISQTGAHKGWRRILDVAARVDPARFRFVLAGDGDMRGELTDEVERRGLADRVTFTGSVHEDDLVSIYRLADVFSLVSDCGPGRGEGVPLTPLEAAACGVPILVGNQDGSREAVTDGENGFVLDPSDLDGHAERLRRLLDRELRLRMGTAARRRIETHHSFDVFVETHRRVLHQVNGT
jgi:phosphatidylinositol alpha-1,6-mannosyltransferase